MKDCIQTSVNKPTRKTRVQWLDVMKCFGIFAIYLGHFGPSGGYSYDFVFTHHVALFFFVSGCTEAVSTSNRKIIPYLQRRVKTILIPYFFFGVLSIIVYTFTTNASARNVCGEFVRMLEGAVRNSFCAEALWFLTCLFVVQVMFVLLNRVCPKWLLLIISTGLAFIAYAVMDPSPIKSPKFFYNVDSALYYFFYYVLGYLLFPVMQMIFTDIKKYKIPIALLSMFSLVYAMLLFFQNEYLMSIFQISIWGSFLFNVQPILIIWLYAVVARWMQHVEIFNEIGRETLYLCGSEYMIKTGINVLVLSFGFTVEIISPMAAYIYSAFMIWLGFHFFVPIEKKLFRAVTESFTGVFVKKKFQEEDENAFKSD